MGSLELLICLGLIGLSAFLSASEIALFSLNKFQIRSIKDRTKSAHRYIKKLLGDPGGVLGTILITNEIANISLSALIGASIAHHPELHAVFLKLPTSVPLWIYETGLSILLTTPVILIFCEVTPKALAAKMNYILAPLTVKPLHLIYEAFTPIRAILRVVIRTLNGPKTQVISNSRLESRLDSPLDLQDSHSGDALVKQNEFLIMLEESHKEGSVLESEFSLIKNLFSLDHTTVEEVATPIAQSFVFLEQMTVQSALTQLRGITTARIPVLSQNRKQLVGVLFAKDLIEARLQPALLLQPISTLVRKPLFVPPNTKLSTLFRKMIQQKNHIAIILASSGGPHGEPKAVITISDLLDELFEDVIPEEDDTGPQLLELLAVSKSTPVKGGGLK